MSVMVGGPLLRRYIGRRFQGLRQRAGISKLEAAEQWQRGRTTISRLEDADESVKFRDVDVKALCEVYGATVEETELLLALTAETRKSPQPKTWWQDHTDSALPDWFSLYIMLEDAAERIRQYEAELIPGLLQTRAYVEELARLSRGTDHDEASRLATVRLERQAVLSRESAPQLDVILNEAVLRRPYGSPEVMADQLGHVLKMAQKLHISVRVVPFSAGGHGGGSANSFSVLDFPRDRTGEPIEPTTAYVDTLAGALYLNKPEQIQMYDFVWRGLEDRVLDESTSIDLITTAMEGFSRG